MRKFLIIWLLICFAAIVVVGYESFGDHVEGIKQFVSSISNSSVASLNTKSCNDATEDFAKKCTQNVNDCKSLQDYTDCTWDVMYRDCGSDKAKKYCNAINLQLEGKIADCNIHCPPLNGTPCSNAEKNLASKCKTAVNNCKDLQNYIDCAWDVLNKDCGSKKANGFFNIINSRLDSRKSSCKLQSPETDMQINSVNSFSISGSIALVLLCNFFWV